MDTKSIMIAAVLDSTNKLLAQYELPPVEIELPETAPACNTEAIEAYKANQGLPPGLDAIMREKFAKADLADKLFDQLQETHCSLRRWAGKRIEETILYAENKEIMEKYISEFKKYEALQK